jgi:signal transduction histidine kinase
VSEPAGRPSWRHAGWDDPDGREAWRRRWAQRGRRGPPRRAFGCLFGIAFVVLGSAFVVVASVALAALGMLGGGSPPGIAQVAAFVVLGVALVAMVVAGRWFRGTARTLDDLVAAASRVEDGDYGVRVAAPRRGPRPLRDLVHGFNMMVERLAADERQRRALLADVSHELRTPLTIVQGNLEAIADGVHLPDPERVAAILEETRTLGRLVDDLRTIALAETGSLPLHREPTDPGFLVAEVAASFAAGFEAARVELATAVPGVLPVLYVDPVRVREIIANLLANALRHTPAGGTVRVRLAAARDQEGREAVAFTVADDGEGIAAGDLPHVFDRFWKGPGSRGSGLGLAIARNLVEAHGGRIEATSERGSGTTVRFTLPAGGG